MLVYQEDTLRREELITGKMTNLREKIQNVTLKYPICLIFLGNSKEDK